MLIQFAFARAETSSNYLQVDNSPQTLYYSFVVDCLITLIASLMFHAGKVGLHVTARFSL